MLGRSPEHLATWQSLFPVRTAEAPQRPLPSPYECSDVSLMDRTEPGGSPQRCGCLSRLLRRCGTLAGVWRGGERLAAGTRRPGPVEDSGEARFGAAPHPPKAPPVPPRRPIKPAEGRPRAEAASSSSTDSTAFKADPLAAAGGPPAQPATLRTHLTGRRSRSDSPKSEGGADEQPLKRQNSMGHGARALGGVRGAPAGAALGGRLQPRFAGSLTPASIDMEPVWPCRASLMAAVSSQGSGSRRSWQAMSRQPAARLAGAGLPAPFCAVCSPAHLPCCQPALSCR